MERIAKTVLDTIPAIARELEALVWRQELGCSVLVSTSVLDNGISLHADSVDHLVLCQPGKTSFLQMLGRVRVREGQRLKVYIQRQTPKQVKGYIDQCKKEAEHPLQDAPKLTDSQDTFGGSCSPSSGIPAV